MSKRAKGNGLARRALLALFPLLFSLAATAQQGANLQPVREQNYVPTGACTLPNYLVVVTVGSGAGLYQCIASTWTRYPTSATGSGYFIGSPTVTPSGTPSTTNLLCVATSATACVWTRPSLDQFAPAFTINSFTTSATNPVEIGATVTNPAFTLSYSSTPTSVAITNTDGIGSPTNLNSPYTSGTVTGAFTHTAQTSVTFTATAVGTSTKTATITENWDYRTFGGVGTAGATGATASGTSAVLTGATGTLASNGLSISQVGATYGPYSPSGQKIYILLIGGSHTFTLNGLSFPMNTPTAVSFVNANGATISMYLYESTNAFTSTFSIVVAS